ncbi:MAG: FAD-dependent oxidoreductase [Bryobacterales bacterium]|nr:FAD-dependent oxidoreductase [Bryobacterales bacterium]
MHFRQSRRGFLQVALAASAAGRSALRAQRQGFVPGRCDVLVYGSTPAGVAAAVSAARAGADVLLIEPTTHFGGIITSGMSNTDFKTFEAVQGFYREFMNRVVDFYRQRYGRNSPQLEDCYHGACYEPSVARHVLLSFIEESGVRLYLGQRLVAVLRELSTGEPGVSTVTLASLSDEMERETRAQVFVDATYEGDLLAMAGCAFRVGRESRAEYGELFAGVNYSHEGRFLHGSTGDGDHRIQCYHFRICMTDVAANRVAILKPEGYRREDFLPVLALLRSDRVTQVMGGIFGMRRIPNGKADINDLMYSPFSLRLPAENYEWPNGGPAERQRIFHRHKSYTLGLWWFLQNDAEVPPSIREEARHWGLPKDEFVNSGHFPPALYVREGRRLHAAFVLTQQHTQRTPGSVRSPVQRDAVAVCDYSLDSHGNSPSGSIHPEVTEGVFNWHVVPYQIPYRVLLPREVPNLLVPVAVSASHVAYSSLRTEPAFTALGQAAGMAAAQMVRRRCGAAGVDVTELQDSLHAAQAITLYCSDVPPGSPWFRAVQHFGTRGLLHHLPEFTDAPYLGRGKPLKGQWLEAYPQHTLSPDLPVSEELARRWSSEAGLVEVLRPAGRSRGAYLAALLAK